MSKPHRTRRDFLTSIAGTGAAWPLCSRFASAATDKKRPNILFAIADDWSWPFASIAGDATVATPAFDRVAREGVLFPHAYTVAPTCTASRGSILTGQWFARLEEGANLWSTLPAKFDVYPDLLERSGYHVGCTGKGWGPGDWQVGGRSRNPAGTEFNKRNAEAPTSGISNTDYVSNFADFLAARPAGSPFCFWYGGREPHRPYEQGSGVRAGKRLNDVRIPEGLPDSPEVRGDLLDYALEIDWFDKQLGRMIQALENMHELDNTLIVVTGDNGKPFPRCKANLYDSGTNVPLAVRWGEKVKGGRVVDDFVSLAEVAPTFLEAAGVATPAAMTAHSMLAVLTSGKSGQVDPKRDHVFTGRERHTLAQPNSNGGYPMRSIRTKDFLYIRNFAPDRFPAGVDTGRPGAYRDIDEGPAKAFMMEHRSDPKVSNLFELGFGKRPAEEIYDLRKDTAELRNVALEPAYAAMKKKLAGALDDQLKAWHDPRALEKAEAFDRYPYHGVK